MAPPDAGTDVLYHEMCAGLRESLALGQTAEAPDPAGGIAATPIVPLASATPARDLTAGDVRCLFLLPPRTCASARPLRRAAVRSPASAGSGAAATAFAADPHGLAGGTRLATLHRPLARQGAA